MHFPAPKTAEAPQSEETYLDNGPVPEGVSICDSEDVCSSSADCKVRLQVTIHSF